MTVENSNEEAASRGLKTIDQLASWPNPVGSPTAAGGTYIEESNNVLDKIISTINHRPGHLDSKTLQKT